ncbi:hypothetical protein [Thermomonospora umbrina]|uniref:Uncharacterized protein n=1 Tax=Thermomonospora umbrina TaxID=111806 RepID=A0A3D9SY94_9ACTN|nr:hypothetical protein [Thermomonospora umbrina]REF00538.1 hypothetical protein DFJ69_6086 [Thermomonospora umbrina]
MPTLSATRVTTGRRRSPAAPRRHISSAEASPPTEGEYGPQSADERVLAITLTTYWMLVTGRRLGQRPDLHHLEPHHLIEFWADDHLHRPVTPKPSTP